MNWLVHTLKIVIFISSFLIFTHAVKAEVGSTKPNLINAHVIDYEVYAGGIKAVSAKLIVQYIDEKEYFLKLEASTAGLLGKLAPWQGTFETKGWLFIDDKYRSQPQLHKSISVWRDEEEIKEYNYDEAGKFNGLFIKEHDKEKRQRKVKEDLTVDTIDILTATFNVMNSISFDNECSGESVVFDGKRRFNLVFTHKDLDDFNESAYNIYEGQALKCEVEVIPISGAWHKKPRGWLSIQEQGRQKGSLPTIWMAQVKEEGPVVPVKLRVKTNYGTLFMHIKNYKVRKNIVDQSL